MTPEVRGYQFDVVDMTADSMVQKDDIATVLTNHDGVTAFPSLQKTAEEMELLNASVSALNAFLSTHFLPPIALPEERFHVLDDETMVKASRPGIYGFVLYGNIHISRLACPYDTLRLIVHELIHYACYKYMHVKIVRKGPLALSVTKNVSRLGLAIASTRDDSICFKGIDECATELFASRVSAMAALSLPQYFTQQQVKQCRVESRWHRHGVILLEHLLCSIGEHPSASASILALDYFAGDFSFIPACERRHPGCSRLLRTMGTASEDVMKVCRELSLNQVTAILNKDLRC